MKLQTTRIQAPAQAPPGTIEYTLSVQEIGFRKRFKLLSKTCCLKDQGCDLVRVHVAGRASVLKVAFAICFCITPDTNGCTTVCNSPRKLVELGSLMRSSHTFLIVLTISSHVFLVLLGQFLNCCLDDFIATSLTHRFG